VQYRTTRDVEAAPADVAVALDTLLRAQPLDEPMLRLEQN